MKYTSKITLKLAMLVLIRVLFCPYPSSYTQSKQSNSILDRQFQPLKVGDKAPPVTAFKWVKGTPITEFVIGKVYVVEFGATWCKPCIAAIPRLTALAKKFEEEAEIVSFFVMEYNNESLEVKNPKYVNRVMRFVANQGEKMEYTVAIDDPEKTMENTWLRAAGKYGVPFSFVIDKDGRIAWIGSDPNTLDRVVEAVTRDDYMLANAVEWSKKQAESQTPYNTSKLLLIDGNGGDDNEFLFRSILAKSKGDFKAGLQAYIDSYRYAKKGTKFEALAPFQGRVQAVNAPLAHLYHMAYGDTLWNRPPSRNPSTWQFPDTIKNPHQKRSYGKYWYEPILEVSDSTPFQWNFKSPENKFHYSLKVPLEKASAKYLQQAMQRDLKTYFGYEVNVETRIMPCWKLTATPKGKKELKTKTPGEKFTASELEDGYYYTNGEIRDLIWSLEIKHGEKLEEGRLVKSLPFIDETGIMHKIDYGISKNELQEIDKSFEAHKKYLENLGLNLEKGKKQMFVVVIRDPKQ